LPDLIGNSVNLVGVLLEYGRIWNTAAIKLRKLK
jgi:hypothetical protein